MKKLFVILLLFPVLLTAQNNKFKIGFGLNTFAYALFSDGNNNLTIGATTLNPFFNFDLNFQYFLSENVSLKTKLGYVIPAIEFGGLEYGISGEYSFTSYYTSIGFMRHNNVEGGDYGVEANLNFINAGIGYSWKYFSIEATYFYPLNKKIIYNRSLGAPYVKNPKYIKRIESMIYLSFVFAWDL